MSLLILLYISISIASGLLAWGYYFGGYPSAGLALALLGIIWLLRQSKWQWIASVNLFVLTLLAAMGILVKLPTPAMFTSAFFALLAWDLADFHHRRKQAAKEDQTAPLEKAHFTRLAIVLAIGQIAALIALTSQITFNFEWAVLLLLAGALGTAGLVGRLRKSE